MNKDLNRIWDYMRRRYTSHPWHGINIGEDAPDMVNAFIEMTPYDTVKYEIDKDTGFMKVDRPQKFSNIVPALYGFVPQTYCDEAVANYCIEKTGRPEIVGDGDPLDILVLTERHINQGNIIVPAIPIGGFRMIDGGEADDKIIAVLKGDEAYDWKDINDCPASIINRLKHYFLTYKDMPGQGAGKCEIDAIYGADEAKRVVELSKKDYRSNFGNIESKLSDSVIAALQNNNII